MITLLDQKRLRRNPSYFIGWYQKFSTDEGYICAIISGFIKEKNKSPKGFVQFLDNLNQTSTYSIYNFNECAIDVQKQEIKIGNHTISQKRTQIQTKELKVDFQFTTGHSPHLFKGIGKNILGPLHYVPFVECKHAIISTESTFKGTITNGLHINNIEGKCYKEKDWGQSFPEEYIWIHSNSFENPFISFQFAYAKPKWLLFRPTTYIGFIKLENKTITLNGIGKSNIQFKCMNNRKIELTLQKKEAIINIQLTSGLATQLKAPNEGEMKKIINQSLDSKLKIEVINTKTNKIVYLLDSYRTSSEICLNKELYPS